MLHCEYHFFVGFFSTTFLPKREKSVGERLTPTTGFTSHREKEAEDTQRTERKWTKRSNVRFEDIISLLYVTGVTQTVIHGKDFCVLPLPYQFFSVFPFCYIMVIFKHNQVSVFFSLIEMGERAKLSTQKRWTRGSMGRENWNEYLLLLVRQLCDLFLLVVCSLLWSISLVTVVEADWQPGAAVPHLCSPTLSLCLCVYSSGRLYVAWSEMSKNTVYC